MQNTNTAPILGAEDEDLGKGKDMTIIKVVTYDSECPKQETDDTTEEEQYMTSEELNEDSGMEERIADKANLSGEQDEQRADDMSAE